jgi:hypothetical protein
LAATINYQQTLSVFLADFSMLLTLPLGIDNLPTLPLLRLWRGATVDSQQ